MVSHFYKARVLPSLSPRLFFGLAAGFKPIVVELRAGSLALRFNRLIMWLSLALTEFWEPDRSDGRRVRLLPRSEGTACTLSIESGAGW